MRSVARTAVFAIVLVVLTWSGCGSGLNSATACEATRRVMGGVARGSSCPSVIDWRFDAQRQSFVSGRRVEGHSANGARYVYQRFVRCNDGFDCMAAHTCGIEGIRYNVEAWLIRADGTRESTQPIDDTVCVYPEKVVPAAEVSALAHEEIRRRISAPTFTCNG